MSSIMLLDGSRCFGYQVRWGKATKGETKMFSVRVWGCKEYALREAKKFQEQKDLELNNNVPLPEIKINKNNTSGITGVRIAWEKQRSGKLYPRVCGNWVDLYGETKMYAVSVERHGLETALNGLLRRRSIHGKPVPTLVECVAKLVLINIIWEVV